LSLSETLSYVVNRYWQCQLLWEYENELHWKFILIFPDASKRENKRTLSLDFLACKAGRREFIMINKNNWEETKIKFTNWWAHKNVGRPLMMVIAKKEGADDPLPEEFVYKTMDEKYRNAEHMIKRYQHYCETHEFLAESFPNMSADFGPGSVASYIGSDIVFNEDTVWFNEFVEEWADLPKIEFDPENKWWKEHYALVKKARELAGDDFYIGIPDLMENIDVLASLRGAQKMIFDMIDEPEEVEERIKQISDIYFEYFDRFYDVVKDAKGDSCYTVFQIWGKGKTAKLQCDFSAMMSPTNFRDFIQEPLREQAKKLDNILYHLDGPDAIKHMDAIMEIDEIDALQWTSGDHGPDGTLEDWYVIYDKARKAGKSLWIKVYTGELDDWIAGVDKLVQRYGSHSMFLYFPEMPRADADKLLAHAEKNWSDIKGSFEG